MQQNIQLTSAGATNSRGESSQSQKNWSFPIFRAPSHIRNIREPDFEPKLVSIGPYFHGREHLLPMEELKLRCTFEILKKQPVRLSSYNIDDVPANPFRRLEEDVRRYYRKNFDDYGGDFVQMLVIDSCFIIRIILSLSQQVTGTTFLGVNIKEVKSDLFLLENQIPLFFIQEVYDWILSHMDDPKFPPFEAIVKPFICLDMPWKFNENGIKKETNENDNKDEAAHLLDLYWRCSLSPEIIERVKYFQHIEEEQRVGQEQITLAEIYIPISDPRVIPNATALNRMVGVKFNRHCKGLDVFFSKGIMQMPCLKIDSYQTKLLVNLIAFENSKLPCERIFNSYMKLMDELVDSENDVELLQQCGVIYNTLSSHKMAATFFNDIGNFCLVDYNQHLFSTLYKNVQNYYSSSWNQKWATLQQTYFSSPWAGISVVAGSALLLLSLIQTFYTVYDHYHPQH